MLNFLLLCDLWLWFLAYSIAGWIYETILFRITDGKWLRRGFLVGPLCPIYGFGADFCYMGFGWVPYLVGSPAAPKWKNLLVQIGILFFGGGLMACTMEWFTSIALERMFHTRWWDYFRNRGNIKGRICPLGFAVFGGFCAGLVLVLQPIVVKFTHKIPQKWRIFLAIASGACTFVLFLLTIRREVIKHRQRKALQKA